MATRHAEHEVVEFLTQSGRWPAGTTGTVVQSNDTLALVEIADDHGRALDFVSLPHDALTAAAEQATSAAS